MPNHSRKLARAGAALLAVAAAAAAVTVPSVAARVADGGTVQAQPPEEPNKWTAPPPDA
jgi:hypothetical protein